MSTDEELLPARLQWRNSLVFLLNNSLVYLVAPVFYVGVLHATVIDSLAAMLIVGLGLPQKPPAPVQPDELIQQANS